MKIGPKFEFLEPKNEIFDFAKSENLRIFPKIWSFLVSGGPKFREKISEFFFAARLSPNRPERLRINGDPIGAVFDELDHFSRDPCFFLRGFSMYFEIDPRTKWHVSRNHFSAKKKHHPTSK